MEINVPPDHRTSFPSPRDAADVRAVSRLGRAIAHDSTLRTQHAPVVVDKREVRAAIPLRSERSPCGAAALEWARAMGQRARRDAAQRRPAALLDVTVSAAFSQGHLEVVASLVADELVAVVGEAVEGIGEAVALAAMPPLERPPGWQEQMLPHLDRITRRHRRACQVIAMAERRQALLGGAAPLRREPYGVERVLARVVDHLDAEITEEGGWARVAVRLGEGLEALVEPVDAMVRALEQGGLDAVSLPLLQRAMLRAYEGLAEAILFGLGRRELEPAGPHAPVMRPRARATA